jgi:hypothetical protein
LSYQSGEEVIRRDDIASSPLVGIVQTVFKEVPYAGKVYPVIYEVVFDGGRCRGLFLESDLLPANNGPIIV